MCKTFIVPEHSQAATLCDECWLPLIAQEAQIDSCSLADGQAIMVAHAVAYESTMKTLIYKLKYDSDRLIARDLSLLLVKAINKIAECATVEGAFMVPIPLSRWRKLKRGFNQAELLAQFLSKSTGFPILQSALKRHKHTKAQHNLNKQERSLNLQNAFSFQPRISAPKSVVLLDDIHTSGSTLAEAARTLFSAGVQNVSAITVARALLIQQN